MEEDTVLGLNPSFLQKQASLESADPVKISAEANSEPTTPQNLQGHIVA